MTATHETPALARPRSGEKRPMATELQQVRSELETLANIHARMQEAEETLRAIRQGEVDALFINDADPEAAIGQVFTLSSADRPYRIFVENMQEGAATLSATQVILFANPRLGDLLGCPTSSLVSRPLTEFIAERSAPDLLAAIGSSDIGTTVELTLSRPDGGEVAVLVGISLLDVEDERLTCLTFTDLTAEHGLLNEVRDSQQRYEALYKGAPVPAYTWQDGPTGLVLINYNDAAAVMTGGAVADAVGATASTYYENDLDLLVDLARCLSDQVAMERDTSTPVSTSVAGSPERHLHITMVPVPPDLVLVHTQDITERWVA
ncbi:MAG: hypothetical protein JWN96_1473, partial [Mycobacterium sp.]|nr:hypothetical protein [Mycobacterium sp.]